MHWTCPHCGILANLQSGDMATGRASVLIRLAPDSDVMGLQYNAVRCPSSTCHKFTLDVSANYGAADRYSNGERNGKVDIDKSRPVGIGHVRFAPRVGLPLSAQVPAAVREDYEEACTIKDLSPKAAATLCRRALQGIVRDFWKVSERTLHDELKKIEPQCDSELFKALMAIKSIGNIGAHPEVDINLIIDVEEGEVDALIEVLQILDQDWYVARAARAARLSVVHALGAAKTVAKQANGAASPVPPSGP
jgi:hypothetical protein